MDNMIAEDELDLDLINIIAKIPEHTSRLTLIAQYFDDDGTPVKVSSTMNASDLFHAREDFLHNVEDGDDYDARYVITEEGRRWLEELEKSRQNPEDGDEDFDE